MKRKFKTLLLLFATVAILASMFSACGGDDDDNEPDKPSVEEVDSTHDSNLIGKWSYSYTDMYGGTNYIYREFKSNGVTTVGNEYVDKEGIVQDSDFFEGTWTQRGNTIYFNFYGSKYSVTYRINGNVLIMNFDNGSQEFRKSN